MKLFGKKSVSDIVDVDVQIHKDIYSAQELLLVEAKAVINKKIPYDEESLERFKKLHELGFKNISNVKEWNEIDSKQKQSESIKSIIEYYQQEYPLNRFISLQAVLNICEKYKLLLASVSDYISDIPEKNQKEIIEFKVKRKDIRIPYEIGALFNPIYHPFGFDCKKYYNEKVSGTDLLIIAPENKLNTKDKIKNGRILKIKDPIVLQPVTEGHLIVSSWGLEAGDEKVVNPINN